MNKILFPLAWTISLLSSCQPNTQQQADTEEESTFESLKAWQGNKSGHPAIFAPKVISTGHEFAISFKPDGQMAIK
jgi:hypothetical protein